ncbi:uncharacterized protein LOC133304424 [Gastrolobium bilobum]|uniref:uncharacterized protein LOC133304424 n=1 Tax=Gastrolobium bilobum TaxID=150636 RepID=UPI002AB289B0|nr:uncharacterized protein LOC133304424 [Gastrolobium bilobum]
MDPLPSVNHVFSLVAQQERQLQIEGNASNHDPSRIFFNSVEQIQEIGQSQGRGRGSRLCTYCGKTSHTIETCFEKHGYPPGYKQRSVVHKVNAAVNEDKGSDQIYSTQAETKESFTKSQYQTIMEMIQQSMLIQQKFSPPSSHVSNMVHTKALNADGNSYGATSDLFHSTTTVQEMIGSASLMRGSYVITQGGPRHEGSTGNTARQLNFSNNSSFVSETNATDVWHLCLGHCSKPVIKAMMLQYPFITCKDIYTPCDVYHMAKQKKLSFSLSNVVSKNPFDLVHIDIWGPYFVSSIHGHCFLLTIVDD